MEVDQTEAFGWCTVYQGTSIPLPDSARRSLFVFRVKRHWWWWYFYRRPAR